MVNLDKVKNHRSVLDRLVVENNLLIHFLDMKNLYHDIGMYKKSMLLIAYTHLLCFTKYLAHHVLKGGICHIRNALNNHLIKTEKPI